MIFRNLKLWVKIGGAFLVLIMVSGVMAYFGYEGLNSIDHKVEINKYSTLIDEVVLKTRTAEKEFVIEPSQSSLDNINQNLGMIKKEVLSLKEKMNIESEKEEMDDFLELVASYKTAANKYGEMSFEQQKLRDIFVNNENKMILQIKNMLEEQRNELDTLINNDSAKKLIIQKEKNIKLASLVLNSIDDVGRYERSFIINRDNVELQNKYVDKTFETFENAKDTALKLRASLVTIKDIEQVDELLKEIEIGRDAFNNTVKSELAKDKQKPIMLSSATKMEEMIKGISNQKLSEIELTNRQAIEKILIAVGVATLLGLLFAGIITFSITRPINRGVRFAQEIANGNFNIEKINVKGKDEIGRLALALNEMQEKLNNVLLKISTSSQNLFSSVSEISEGNEELAQRTQNNASSLEEVSATIEEVNSSMQEVAANSGNITGLSENNLDYIKKGSEIMKDTKEEMIAMTGLSAKISEIITTINDIASQTSLLSMNAAIEASRAGEAGKGFAVVADEIGNLAKETSGSAKDISDMIGEIIATINNTGEQIKVADETFDQIVENSSQVYEVISNISNSTQEQASAIEQMQGAVEELNQSTQDNSAMVEEIASSSVSLNDEAQDLNDMVKKFKMKEEQEESDERLMKKLEAILNKDDGQISKEDIKLMKKMGVAKG